MPSKLFQIRRGFGSTVPGILMAYATPIGTALGFASVNPSTGERTWGLANGCAALVSGSSIPICTPVGFQARDSRIFPGLNDAEMLWGFGLETPYFVGTSGSVEPGEDIEVEGDYYVLSASTTKWADGTTTGLSGLSAQLLSAATPLNTELTFANGLLAKAASGDEVVYRLNAIMTNNVNSGTVRIFANKVPGYVKA